MVLTGENQNTLRGKTCLVATLYTTNPTWIGLSLNLNLCGNRSTTYCLSHCIACTTFKFYYFCSILKCTHIMLFCILFIYFPCADLQILSTYLFLILLQFFLLSYLYFRIIFVSYGISTFVQYVLNITYELLLVLEKYLDLVHICTSCKLSTRV
jgi:hypothetical protein